MANPTHSGRSPHSSPKGSKQNSQEHGNAMFGFTAFLLSESMVFLSFFAAYIILRQTTPNWLPPGVPKLEVLKPAISTAVLVSSSFVLYFAERALDRRKLAKFRLLWLLASLMGTYFLVNQAIEWNHLSFGLTTGLFGATFYLLTGFHGLHVFVGIILQLIMLVRSFIPGNYNAGHFGVSAASLFWHFVDVIWIVLFSLVYLW
ncbi:heme-copper oxidase subunit III [Microcoleus sp. Pol12A5]|uniref:heme-copper oxidase subunit III n=1 Tax=Microcoleus sp. Pol12A5 TaxID=3055392 RepID=UPI002FD72433